MRANVGMVFQEGALFDSLTVRENVGYRLYEETYTAARGGRSPRRRSARVHRPRRVHRSDAVGALGRAAAARRDRAGDGVEAEDPAVRRSHHRPRSDHRDDGGRRSHQAAGPRERQFDCRHASAARRVLRRDEHRPSETETARFEIVPAGRAKEQETEFLMLRDGLIVFEGDADALRELHGRVSEDVSVVAFGHWGNASVERVEGNRNRRCHARVRWPGRSSEQGC